MPHVRPGRRLSRVGLALLVGGMLVGSKAQARAEAEFPFDRELLLDTVPMKGSKRVPSLDIRAGGAAEIILWCNTVPAQLVVAGDTITIIPGPGTERQCPPERLRGDDEILGALAEVTNWRRDGDLLVLTGGRTLRFRLQTN